MRILVTGGAGFLGKHLVRRLLDEGQSVRVVDLEPFEDDRFDHADVEFLQGDITDEVLMDRACRGVDVVVHAAAALPIQSRDVIRHTDVTGTRRTLQAADQNDVDRFVFISSSAVYGLPDADRVTEDTPKDPIDVYGQAKLDAEAECLKYADEMVVSILRPKAIVGKERLGILEVLFDWIRRGKRIYMLGDGTNRYQLIDVEDFCEAIWLACTHPEADDAFNVGATEFGTINEDLRPIFDEAGSGSHFVYLPARPIQWILACLEKLNLSPIVKWQYMSMTTDNWIVTDKIRDKLGWEPEKSNVDMLLENFRWYMSHHEELKGRTGKTHRVPWDQKVLKWIRKFS